MKYGLLGRTLGHSVSGEIHRMLGNPDYSLIETDEKGVGKLLRERAFAGLNVTVPYKKTVLPYCDALSETVLKTGAANTLTVLDGRLIADNTDASGFERLLLSAGVSAENKKVLILGSGGTAGTVRYVMEKRKAACIVNVSRTGTVNYQNVYALHGDAAILVNSTPVGMYPDTEKCPIDIGGFGQLSCVLDVIYNPKKTVLLRQAEQKGIRCAGGLLMLVWQAAEAEKIWTGRTCDDEQINRIMHETEELIR